MLKDKGAMRFGGLTQRKHGQINFFEKVSLEKNAVTMSLTRQTYRAHAQITQPKCVPYIYRYQNGRGALKMVYLSTFIGKNKYTCGTQCE
jgi:hypothetical protein